MSNEILKGEIKEYLKDNLRLQIQEEWYRDYGSSGTSVTFKLILEEDVISEDSITINKE